MISFFPKLKLSEWLLISQCLQGKWAVSALKELPEEREK